MARRPDQFEEFKSRQSAEREAAQKFNDFQNRMFMPGPNPFGQAGQQSARGTIGQSGPSFGDVIERLRGELATARAEINMVRCINADLQSKLRQTNWSAPANHWTRVLHVAPDAPREVIEASYRALSRTAHPDAGGSEDAMKQLNAAKDAALKARA